MTRYILRRSWVALFTLFGVTVATFFLIRLIPGDPILLMFPGQREIPPETYRELFVEYGFDKPIWQQYFTYIGGILQGDLGVSAFTRQPVLSEFFYYFPATVELAVSAVIFGIVLGIPAGIIAAIYRGSMIYLAVMGTALVGYSLPIFWWALVLITFFSGYLGVTPSSGRISAFHFPPAVTGLMLVDTLIDGDFPAFRSALHHLVLPAVSLGMVPLAVFARQTRSAMAEVLNEDYVRTARAKGLPELRVLAVHALRNALIPIVTIGALTLGALLAGAILVETVFAWPGLGTWIVKAILARDYQVIQGGVLLIACVLISINLVVDLLYGILDPRIRLAGA